MSKDENPDQLKLFPESEPEAKAALQEVESGPTYEQRAAAIDQYLIVKGTWLTDQFKMIRALFAWVSHVESVLNAHLKRPGQIDPALLIKGMIGSPELEAIMKTEYDRLAEAETPNPAGGVAPKIQIAQAVPVQEVPDVKPA